jgi:hypothetical protein
MFDEVMVPDAISDPVIVPLRIFADVIALSAIPSVGT